MGGGAAGGSEGACEIVVMTSATDGLRTRSEDVEFHRSFGRRNFVAKLPRNSAPGYGSASVFASVFTGRSPIFACIWRWPISVLGITCIWIRGLFWTATCVGISTFLFGAGVIHVSELARRNNVAAGNAGPVLYLDFALPILMLILLAIRNTVGHEKS